MTAALRRRSLIGAAAGTLVLYLGLSPFVLSDLRSDWLLLAYALQLAAVLILIVLFVRQRAVIWPTEAALRDANAELLAAQASLATANSALRFTKDELKRTRQQLIDGIEGLTDGFALYDAQDRLVVCNSRYRELFGLDPEFLRPGTPFEAILRAHVAAGRIPDAVGREETWVAERLRQHRDPSGVFERRIDGHWYQFSDRPTSDGGTVTIFSRIDALKQREQRLRENQVILQTILDHISVSVCITDRERRIVLMNRRLEELYGVKATDAIGRDLADVRPDRYRQIEVGDDLHRVITTGEPILSHEDRYDGESGAETWITSIVPIKDDAGEVRYVLRTGLEVPQLAKANRELADYRAFLVEAERLARMTSWHQQLGTEDGLVWSENVIDVLGVPAEAIETDADYLALIHPDDRERMAQEFREVTERPGNHEAEYRIVKPDGTTAWIRGIAKVQLDASGNPDRLIGTIQDITKQKFIEAALRESEARLRAFMDNAPAAIAMKDRDRRFVLLNTWVEQAYGRRAADLIGRRSVEIVDSEGTRALDAMESEVLATGQTVTREVHFPERGAHSWMHEVKFPIRDAGGTIAGIGGIAIDISDRKRAEAARKETEMLLRSFMDHAPMAMVVKDLERRFLMLNAPVVVPYGRSGNDALGNRTIDLSQSEGARRIDAMEREVVATGRAVTAEVFFADRSVSPWTYEIKFPIRDVAGRLVAIGGLALDITDRKKAEIGLRDSEARLRRAQEQARLAYWHWQIETDDYQWAPGSGRILGMPDAELPRSEAGYYALIHLDDRHRMRRIYDSVQAGEDRFNAEFRILRPDGRVIWVEETGEIERDAAGRRVSVAGITQDVTERKQAESALRDSEARLRRAQQQARLAYWSWQFATDGSPEEYYWSPGSGLLLGVADADMPTDEEGARRVTHPDDLERVRQLYADVRASRDQYAVEYRLVRFDGGIVWVREIGEVLRDPEGRRIGVEGTLQDITDRRLLEEQLLQSRKMEAIGQLTGGIAHDFNNLLAVILGNLELLGEELAGNASARQKIAAALRSTLRGSDLTYRLLAYARRQPLAPKTTRVDELIRGMRDLLLRPLGPTIEAGFALDEGLWPTEIDQSQLETSLLNLVINARDAMPEGGKLVITAANVAIGRDGAQRHENLAPGDYVRIAVSDTGTGMSEAVRDRAFDPFFTTKGIGKGTGLGLSMVYGFVKQSGGHIEIDSAVGCGTTVNIYLPRAKAAAADSAARNPRSTPIGKR